MKKKQKLKSPNSPQRWTRKRSLGSRLADFGMGLAGVGIAAVSLYLPYYVYNNSSEFGPPTMAFNGRATQPDDVPEPVLEETLISSIRTPLFENDDDEGIDPVVTGSIRSNASAPTKDQARIFQERRRPAPVSQKGQQSDIQLVFATRGRALIRDGDDLLPVAIGSRLPDGSIVKSVARSNNQWTLLTSTNQVLELSN